MSMQQVGVATEKVIVGRLWETLSGSSLEMELKPLFDYRGGDDNMKEKLLVDLWRPCMFIHKEWN